MDFKTFNLQTKTLSKKTWKTYNGASKNCSVVDIVISQCDSTSFEDIINWINRHPEYAKERLEQIK